ncbi:hypothetical protein NLG97_g8800 [Lecanicillium saksenae]|uniref:Uncharacterized protein n=1 Tax=Lecanicillium saksenae TaxID=468837 RepID=A0ACC1QID9_9HYPO|nr:hypothetical protein NLG97_g8800 [Lecanicillium saksenae]
MASNVIDLISSSPPRRATPPRLIARARPGASQLAHVEIHSDDFCSSDEGISSNTRSVDGPSAKRPRLSGEDSANHGFRGPGAGVSTQSLQVNGPKEKPGPEEIECISSFEADVAFSSPKPRTTGLQRSRAEPMLPSSLIPDSDPFASSPPKPAKSTHAQIAQDLLSDPFASSSPAKEPASRIASTNAAREAARPKSIVVAWDPISSSAPCSSAPPRTTAPPNHRSRSPSVISIGDSSASSDGELPAIGNFDLSQGRSSHHNYLASAPKSKSTTKPKRKASDPKQSRPRQTIDAGQRAAAKAQEKEQKRQEREREKEERQRQRDVAAAIAEVNKAKGNRKVSTKEMIVDIPTSLPSTIKVQLETLLDGLEVQHLDYDGDLHVVRWRRKVNSKFDDESGQWVPTPLRIEKEEHALVFMAAEDMVQLALDDALDSHMSTIRRQYPNEKLVYVLQGVTTWMRKNRNIRNRQFAAGVRSQEAGQPANGRRRADQAEYIDEDMVEDAILRLQVEHDVLIHHTAIPLETAQWISIFTQNISTIPRSFA